MKTVDVLVQARELIAAGGLAKLNFEQRGAYCTLGAIRRIIGPIESFWYSDTRPGRYLRAAIAENGYDRSLGIPSWNDAPSRTKEEVLAVYDTAIKNARRRHIRGDRQKAVK